MNKGSREKWVNIKGHKIYDGGLWKKTDNENPLSELVEIEQLTLLGEEDGYELYVSNNPSSDVKDLLKEGIGEDNHVYLRVSKKDMNQVAQLWPY